MTHRTKTSPMTLMSSMKNDYFSDIKITAANADEKIKQLYETAFPEDEQIPWKDLMRLVEEMPLDFTAYYDGEEFIGFRTL